MVVYEPWDCWAKCLFLIGANPNQIPVETIDHMFKLKDAKNITTSLDSATIQFSLDIEYIVGGITRYLQTCWERGAKARPCAYPDPSLIESWCVGYACKLYDTGKSRNELRVSTHLHLSCPQSFWWIIYQTSSEIPLNTADEKMLLCMFPLTNAISTDLVDLNKNVGSRPTKLYRMRDIPIQSPGWFALVGPVASLVRNAELRPWATALKNCQKIQRSLAGLNAQFRQPLPLPVL